MRRWMLIVAATVAVTVGGFTLGVAQENPDQPDPGQGGAACASPIASPLASPLATPVGELAASPAASPGAQVECATPEMGTPTT